MSTLKNFAHATANLLAHPFTRTRRDTPAPDLWLSDEDFSLVMRAHKGIAGVPADRRLEYLAARLASTRDGVTAPMYALILNLWGPQTIGGHGRSVVLEFDPETEPAPQVEVAVEYLKACYPAALEGAWYDAG